MEVEVVQCAQRVVQAGGSIDLSNVERFKEPLFEAARESPHGFVIDLSDVDYIDSAGIQVILVAYKLLRSTDGKLALVVKNPDVWEILTITGLQQLPGFTMWDNLESALEALALTP
jgi:stage II sporulation protein AA (anti-sigma F factor antagonist)